MEDKLYGIRCLSFFSIVIRSDKKTPLCEYNLIRPFSSCGSKLREWFAATSMIFLQQFCIVSSHRNSTNKFCHLKKKTIYGTDRFCTIYRVHELKCMACLVFSTKYRCRFDSFHRGAVEFILNTQTGCAVRMNSYTLCFPTSKLIVLNNLWPLKRTVGGCRDISAAILTIYIFKNPFNKWSGSEMVVHHSFFCQWDTVKWKLTSKSIGTKCWGPVWYRGHAINSAQTAEHSNKTQRHLLKPEERKNGCEKTIKRWFRLTWSHRPYQTQFPGLSRMRHFTGQGVN